MGELADPGMEPVKPVHPSNNPLTVLMLGQLPNRSAGKSFVNPVAFLNKYLTSINAGFCANNVLTAVAVPVGITPVTLVASKNLLTFVNFGL